MVYTLAANFHLTTPENKAVYRQVKITGTCRGVDGDPLVAAIMAQQRALNHPYVDGKASVVTGTGKISDKAFFLIRLEARFAVMFPDAWPRLDLIPNCPSSVLEVSRGAVPNLAEISRDNVGHAFTFVSVGQAFRPARALRALLSRRACRAEGRPTALDWWPVSECRPLGPARARAREPGRIRHLGAGTRERRGDNRTEARGRASADCYTSSGAC